MREKKQIKRPEVDRTKNEESQKATAINTKVRRYARYGRGCTRDCIRACDGRVVSANDKGKKYSVLHGETDVDQEVATATGDEGRRCRRKDDGDLASVHDSIKQLSNK